MMPNSSNLVEVTVLYVRLFWLRFFVLRSTTFRFRFLIQLDVTKYSRQVLRSPNLRRLVYIAAHVR